MEFRPSTVDDLNSIMAIIRQAQEYFRKQGIDQWQNNYPQAETILNDVISGYGYVLLEDDIIIGTMAVVFDGDRNYDTIEGKWLSHGKYAAIHRIAVEMGRKGAGFASVMIAKVKGLCARRGINSIKVDTHERNLSMQKLLQKNGFSYCGIILVEDRSKRMAFEKIL